MFTYIMEQIVQVLRTDGTQVSLAKPKSGKLGVNLYISPRDFTNQVEALISDAVTAKDHRYKAFQPRNHGDNLCVFIGTASEMSESDELALLDQ